MICTKHRKRLATADDMRAYSSRPYCVSKGDCSCHVCSKVCWSSECEQEISAKALDAPHSKW